MSDIVNLVKKMVGGVSEISKEELQVYVNHAEEVEAALENFKKVIADSEYSDEALARILDVSRPTIARWRDNVTAPHEAIAPELINKLKD